MHLSSDYFVNSGFVRNDFVNNDSAVFTIFVQAPDAVRLPDAPGAGCYHLV
jgi:hypothetical protein